MMMRQKKLLIPLLLCVPLLAYASPESGLKEQLEKISVKIEQAASRKPFRFAFMNESLSLTARAIGVYRRSQLATSTVPPTGPGASFYLQDTPLRAASSQRAKDLDEAETLFRQAAAKYPENPFASLWIAVIEAERGEHAKSNERFSAFLKQEGTDALFEKTVLNPQELGALKAAVRSLLQAQGIPIPESGKDSVLSRWLRDFRKLGAVDRTVNVVFAAGLLCGTVGMLFAYFSGNLYPKGWPRLLTGLYFCGWMGFGFWVADLAVGLPFHVSRFWFVPRFLILAAALLVLREMFSYWKERYSPAEKGFYRCPGCGHIFSALMLECPECRRKKRA